MKKAEQVLEAKARRAILAGEHPALTWPSELPCPVEAGEEVFFNVNLSATVTRIRQGTNGEHLVEPRDYVIRDFRPRLLRRVPGVFDPPELDENGQPLPPDPEAIERARLDGSYTTAASRAVADAGEAVDDDTLRRFTAESRLRAAESREEERGDELAAQQTKRLMRRLRRLQTEAARYGVDLSPRLLPIIREVEREIAGKRAA